ncbi:unnamed protein product, partial [Nesidiocoris tenuis]
MENQKHFLSIVSRGLLTKFIRPISKELQNLNYLINFIVVFASNFNVKISS